MIYAHLADKILSAVQWNTQTMSAKYQEPISATYLFACVKSVAGWLIPPQVTILSEMIRQYSFMVSSRI